MTSYRVFRLASTTLLSLCVFSSCSRPEEPASSRAEIYGGTPADAAQVGAVQIGWFVGPGVYCNFGSGVMLTNEWLLSAAHVLKDPCGTTIPTQLVVSMRGTPFDQSQVYGATEIAQLKIHVHPKYVADDTGNSNYGWDAALVKLKQPLLIQGSTTGYRRWLTPKPASDFVLAGKKSFYGYSFLSPPATWPPAQSDFGNPATADFTVVPYPGISANPGKLGALLKKGPSPNEISVLRGGGIFPSTNPADIVPVGGDSGGPLFDIADPILLTGDIIGILESGDVTDKFPNGAPQPEFALFRSFRFPRLCTRGHGGERPTRHA